MAEVIKYGIIADRDFFFYLADNIDLAYKLDENTLSKIIQTCCSIKADITTKDEKEKAGRTHYIEKLKKQAARIAEFLEKNEPKPGKQYKEVRSNVTDNESATMTTSHGTLQGYNGQALVDAKHQVIVEGEAFGSGQDHYHLEPVVAGAQENMKGIGKGEDYFKDAILTADTAYHSGENIKRCEELSGSKRRTSTPGPPSRSTR